MFGWKALNLSSISKPFTTMRHRFEFSREKADYY